jgi:hypothetical protein
MSADPSPSDIRRDAIINSATEQIRALLETHFRDIGKAAEQSFEGDEKQTEPTAKVAVAVEWPVLSQAAKVAVKIAWSVRYKDESDEEVDPLQSKLGLADPLGNLKKTLRQHGATMTIKTGDKTAEIK